MSVTAETARNVIARIQRNERERSYCLAVLDLWAQVQDQGIDIGRVASFGYDPRAVTPAQKRQHKAYGTFDPFVERLPTGALRPRFYNYVRHHDGGKTRLDPMLPAVHKQESDHAAA